MMILKVKIMAAVRNRTDIGSGFVLLTRSAPIDR
jgi:hypothetical protein